MPTYLVEVSRTIRTTVEVEAETPEGALDKASRKDFELPPRDEWSGDKDWEHSVMDAEGTELIDVEGNHTEDYPED